MFSDLCTNQSNNNVLTFQVGRVYECNQITEDVSGTTKLRCENITGTPYACEYFTISHDILNFTHQL